MWENQQFWSDLSKISSQSTTLRRSESTFDLKLSMLIIKTLNFRYGTQRGRKDLERSQVHTTEAVRVSFWFLIWLILSVFKTYASFGWMRYKHMPKKMLFSFWLEINQTSLIRDRCLRIKSISFVMKRNWLIWNALQSKARISKIFLFNLQKNWKINWMLKISKRHNKRKEPAWLSRWKKRIKSVVEWYLLLWSTI